VQSPSLIPTAANVAVGGRILTADGRGIRNAEVTITGANGISQTTQTGSFGIYKFSGIEVGVTYTVTVNAKKFYFMQPSRIITVEENVANLDFVALE
jgi:hypothetical protein